MNFKEKLKTLSKKLKSFEFKINDKVIINKQEKIGTILELSSTNNDYYLIDINGTKSYFEGCDLKLHQRKKIISNKLNKGDVVKTSEGLSGKITKVYKENNGNQYLYWVNHQGPYNNKEITRGK